MGITRMIIALLLNAGLIFLLARVTPGVRIKSYGTAVGVALVYGLLTVFLKWLLVVLSFPLIIVTFGLFLVVINGVLLWITDKIVDGIEIKGFPSLAMMTVGVTIGSTVINWLMGG